MPFKDPEAARAYNREYMKTYFSDPEKREKHNAMIRVNSTRSRAEKRAWITNYLLEHPCVDCGEADLDVLDFDHVRGEKRFAISAAARAGYSLETVIAEVAKCEVRCANCHRRVTRRRALASSGVVGIRGE